MATLKVTDQELQTILSELESDLEGYLSNTKDKLAKAREEDASPSAGMGSASASPMSPSASVGSPSASASSPSAEESAEGTPSPAPEGAEGSAAPAMEAEGAPPAEEGMPGEGAPPAEGMPGEEGAPSGEVDPAALEAEYAKLPLPELQQHYLAVKAALFAAMGGGASAAPAGAPSPSAPPAAPAPGPSAAPAGAPPMAMNEDKLGVSQEGNGGQSVAVAKSEVAELQAQISELTKIVNLFVGKPVRKAVTGLDYVAKSETPAESKPVNPTEITGKLAQLTRDPDLKKSDRDLINRYYEGTAKVDAIAHLLK